MPNLWGRAMRRVHDLDAKDREILALLEADGRRSSSEIARLTSLSAPTVAERIARLRDIGVIRGLLGRHQPGQGRPADLRDHRVPAARQQ